MKYLVSLISGVAWLAGFVLAKGFFSTLLCIIPFWAWYLVVEKILVSLGIAQ
ncbi:hypothetical protein LIX82_001813 [Vibrio parahaemolyticus]|nr:hypothetical protein [Vibrio parahaemolyticus]EHU9585054.1 hypothetical protein [Vibrio parahaemolyticus]EHV2826031.1 hypothetical protein [Vibrio parahaemolyticus]EHZ7324566.1 hypothetical protein [Vibrio parahaemolyticus]EHZ7441092.1 hypothetical protein [Vibrio parahaemolyticus]